LALYDIFETVPVVARRDGFAHFACQWHIELESGCSRELKDVREAAPAYDFLA
jgi:hypothetical protein